MNKLIKNVYATEEKSDQIKCKENINILTGSLGDIVDQIKSWFDVKDASRLLFDQVKTCL